MKRTLITLAIALSALAAACAPPPTGGGGTTTTTVPSPGWLTPTFFDEMIDQFNVRRAGDGLGPVSRCGELDAIAQRVIDTDPLTNGYSQDWVAEYSIYGSPPLYIGNTFGSAGTPTPVTAANTLYDLTPGDALGLHAFNQPGVVDMGFGAAEHPGTTFPNQVFVTVGEGGNC